MAGSDSAIYRGFYDTPMIQDRLREYAQHSKPFQLIALRQRNPLSILTVLSEKFGIVPASLVSDWKFKYQEFDELPFSFTLKAASARPASGSLIDYIELTNSEAASLNPSHRLLSLGTYMGLDLSGGVTTSNCSATFNVTNAPLNEVLRILEIGRPSSAFEGNAADTGYTWIKVQRAHPGQTVTGQVDAIPISTQLKLVNFVAKTNSRPNPPIGANGSYLENVVQICRESYGIGEHLTMGGGIKTLLLQDGNAQLDLNMELTQMRFMKTFERGLLAGRRFESSIGADSEYETGGILEFIKAANWINANGILNLQKVNNIVATALDLSGVRELWMFGGSTYTKNLAEAFENKRGFGESTQMSVRYGLKVYELEGTGRDGIVYYMHAPILSEMGMDNQALILNLTEYNYGEKNVYGAFQIAEKVPLLDFPDDAESFDKNAGFHGTWRELYMAYGLVRRLQDTHFRVYGVTSAS